MSEQLYPKPENLGRDCMYWQLGGLTTACCYPKAELEGRRSCEGLIDDVCLLLKDGIQAESLTDEQMIELRHTPPSHERNINIPPGQIPPM